MSKEVDALILIAHSNRILADISGSEFEDVGTGMHYIYEGKETWYNGVPITESDRTNLYAGDVLLSLGHVATRIFTKESLSLIKDANPFKSQTIDAITSISPYKDGGSLEPPSDNVSPYLMQNNETGVPMMFEDSVTQKSAMLREFIAKWAISEQIHTDRGTINLQGYDIEELLDGLRTVNFAEIAPLDITDSSYGVGDIIDHTGAKSRPIDFPFYTSFKGQENSVEMLEAALEDLTKVAKAIK